MRRPTWCVASGCGRAWPTRDPRFPAPRAHTPRPPPPPPRRQIGWDDDGSPVGLCEEDLTASIDTLTAFGLGAPACRPLPLSRRPYPSMARSLEAEASVVALRDVDGASAGLRTAEVLVRRSYSTTGMREIRGPSHRTLCPPACTGALTQRAPAPISAQWPCAATWTRGRAL